MQSVGVRENIGGRPYVCQRSTLWTAVRLIAFFEEFASGGSVAYRRRARAQARAKRSAPRLMLPSPARASNSRTSWLRARLVRTAWIFRRGRPAPGRRPPLFGHIALLKEWRQIHKSRQKFTRHRCHFPRFAPLYPKDTGISAKITIIIIVPAVGETRGESLPEDVQADIHDVDPTVPDANNSHCVIVRNRWMGNCLFIDGDGVYLVGGRPGLASTQERFFGGPRLGRELSVQRSRSIPVQ